MLKNQDYIMLEPNNFKVKVHICGLPRITRETQEYKIQE